MVSCHFLDGQEFVQVGTLFDTASPLSKYDETVLRPCSLGLMRMKPPSQCGGIGGRALTPLSLGRIPEATMVDTIAGSSPMLLFARQETAEAEGDAGEGREVTKERAR